MPEHLEKAKPILKKLDEISAETGYSRIELAIGYVKNQEGIDHLVFGIRDIEQLKQDIEAFQMNLSADVINALEDAFIDVDTDIVVPSLWKK